MSSPKSIGRYEILEELGHGAMGTVYRAKDPAMDRVVALKTIISVALVSQQGSEFRERFYREARAAGRLAHPGIVPVFDVGEHEGLPYLVMEFINGRTLADSVKAKERLTLERVCEIGQQIAEALGYAHQHGVIHRDIKPANILLTSLETYKIERPKITDFGVAKLAAGQITLSGQMLGTPAFMPPEQFTGAPVDGRADLFSLGVILYWMATGEQPFPGETMTSVSYKVVHIEPIPPTKLNPSIPLKLEGIILKCLAKNPDERYQTGEDLARDLAELRGVANANLQRTAIRNPAAALAQTPAQAAATIGADLQATMPNVPAPSQPSASAGPASSKSASWQVTQIAIGVLALIAIAAVGWLALRPKPGATSTQPAASAAQAIAQPVPATPAQPVTEQKQPAPSAQRPAAIALKPAVAAKAATPSADGANTRSSSKAPDLTPSADSAGGSTRVAAVDFSPKSLDANSNAKLKIDLPHVPDTFAFTVEMNGKRYLRWNGSEKKDDYQNLFVPPGIQEFRVMVQSGKVRITSNTVSTEFKAKKRKTLKIELRDQPKSSSGPAVLSPDSQLFVTLK